jgi:hypothetical protein
VGGRGAEVGVSRGGGKGAGGPAERVYEAFERAAAETAERFARDPGVLAFGAGLLRSQLLFARAAGLFVEASLAPFEAMRAAAAAATTGTAPAGATAPTDAAREAASPAGDAKGAN